VIKSALKDQYKKFSKLRENLSPLKLASKGEHVKRTFLEHRRSFSKDNIKQLLVDKRHKLEETIHAPPFLRTSDKCAFTIGIAILILSEFIILRKPSFFPTWYSFLLFPLMVARYYFYRKVKYQYFMLGMEKVSFVADPNDYWNFLLYSAFGKFSILFFIVNRIRFLLFCPVDALVIFIDISRCPMVSSCVCLQQWSACYQYRDVEE